MAQVSISICVKVWWQYEHLYSQPWWQLGASRKEGTVCWTFVCSSPADCTCSLHHQWPGTEAFWKAAAVRSKAWKNCMERESKLSYLKVWERPLRYMSVSEHWRSWIWGQTLTKHVKGNNWVRSFDFFFPLFLLKAWIILTCVLCFHVCKFPSSHLLKKAKCT